MYRFYLFQLERENEKLRKDFTVASNVNSDKGAIDGLQELLNAARRNVEQKSVTINEQKTELHKLRIKVKELQEKLDEMSANSNLKEAAAQELFVQNNELRNKLTDARYTAAVDRKDEHDRYSSL